jgi:hypothetical protein
MRHTGHGRGKVYDLRVRLAVGFVALSVRLLTKATPVKVPWIRLPSSKTCGDCGAINTGLTLADRVWVCQCGATHDRDRNAARNLLAAMHAAA